MKRGLVVSGGGSKGAWAGGIVEYLKKEKNIDWDVYVGTSTGNLVTPFTAIGDIKKLKEAFLNINSDSIFAINPFNKKGKVKFFNAIWRVITGKTSLGDGKRLKKLIHNLLTEEDFEKMKEKTVISTVTNLTKGKTEYKYNTNCESKTDFCDWMFASGSVPLGFEIFNKNGEQYVDGGIFENIPIQKAIDEGCEEIDVIILSPKKKENANNEKIDNMFELTSVIINTMLNQFEKDDLTIANLKADKKEVKVNFYYTPYSLTDNYIKFDKNEMTGWWKEGYEFAKDNFECEKMLLK